MSQTTDPIEVMVKTSTGKILNGTINLRNMSPFMCFLMTNKRNITLYDCKDASELYFLNPKNVQYYIFDGNKSSDAIHAIETDNSAKVVVHLSDDTTLTGDVFYSSSVRLSDCLAEVDDYLILLNVNLQGLYKTVIINTNHIVFTKPLKE